MISFNGVSYVLLSGKIPETGYLMSDVFVNAMPEHIPIIEFYQKIGFESELIIFEAQP